MRMPRDLLLLAITSQACALAAIAWLPPRVGLYVQIVPAVMVIVAAASRFRSGVSEYRRLKTRSTAHETELRRLVDSR
jgi:hypothetical protein